MGLSRMQPFIVLALLVGGACASHYEKPPCQDDEVQGAIQGGSFSGVACLPKCEGLFGSCPTDVASGVTAKPECAIKDQTGAKYCGLICSSDSDCDTAGGAKCSLVQGTTGICEYPSTPDAEEAEVAVFSVELTAIAAPDTTHYEKPPCQDDEVEASIQGGSFDGSACFPKCTSSGSCPTDVISGVTAQPQCAIQDQSGDKYCGLICSSDSECDTTGGAKCAKIQGTVGICEYPTTKLGARLRLAMMLQRNYQSITV